MSKCALCPNDAALDVEAPAIRLCLSCANKLRTHIAAICTGCNTCYWLPKTPQNVVIAAELSGLPLGHIQDECVIHQMASCKRCYEHMSEYVVSKNLQ